MPGDSLVTYISVNQVPAPSLRQKWLDREILRQQRASLSNNSRTRQADKAVNADNLMGQMFPDGPSGDIQMYNVANAASLPAASSEVIAGKSFGTTADTFDLWFLRTDGNWICLTGIKIT